MSHTIAGASWEGYAIENILSSLPGGGGLDASFRGQHYRPWYTRALRPSPEHAQESGPPLLAGSYL